MLHPDPFRLDDDQATARRGPPPTIHATTVCLGERAIVLRGAPGSGKSTLALALIERWRGAGGHAALVADDRTVLRAVHGALIATAPAALAGVMERRGLGFIAPPALTAARVGLVVDLVPADRAARLPAADQSVSLCGIAIAQLILPAGAPIEAALIITAALHGDGTRTHPVDPPGPVMRPAHAAG